MAATRQAARNCAAGQSGELSDAASCRRPSVEPGAWSGDLAPTRWQSGLSRYRTRWNAAGQRACQRSQLWSIGSRKSPRIHRAAIWADVRRRGSAGKSGPARVSEFSLLSVAACGLWAGSNPAGLQSIGADRTAALAGLSRFLRMVHFVGCKGNRVRTCRERTPCRSAWSGTARSPFPTEFGHRNAT
jgi:hypothetical protein